MEMPACAGSRLGVEFQRARARHAQLLVQLEYLIVGNQLALGIDEIVLRLERLDLPLGVLELAPLGLAA